LIKSILTFQGNNKYIFQLLVTSINLNTPVRLNISNSIIPNTQHQAGERRRTRGQINSSLADQTQPAAADITQRKTTISNSSRPIYTVQTQHFATRGQNKFRQLRDTCKFRQLTSGCFLTKQFRKQQCQGSVLPQHSQTARL
jgi:hypothetical protein